MTTLKQRWLELCLDLSLEPARIVVGSRKILRAQTWTISGDDWRAGEFDVEEIVGYNSWRAKKQQLMRYYIDDEELDRAHKKYEHIRDNLGRFDSIVMPLQHERKGGFTKQDHCMASLVVSFWPKKRDRAAHSEIDVYYRTTEIAKKFAADLLLFREEVFPKFEPFSRVRFYFSTCNMSVAFTPALFLTMEDPIGMLREIKEHDHRHWRRVSHYLYKYLLVETAMKFRQHDRLKTRLNSDLSPNKRMKLVQYLRENEREILRKMPVEA